MSTRINARLEDELARKLAYLQVRTGKSPTELVKASLETYFDKVVGESGAGALLEAFIGSGSGAPELSESYKALHLEGLDDKLRAKRSVGRR